MGTLLLDLRPEAGFYVWPFREHEPSAEGLCMCLWKVSLFSVQLESTRASKHERVL